MEETHWDLVQLFEQRCEKGECRELFLKYMGELFDKGLLMSNSSFPRFFGVMGILNDRKGWDYLHEFVKAHRLELEYESGKVLA